MLVKGLLVVVVLMGAFIGWQKLEAQALVIENQNLTKERDAAVNSKKALETTIEVQATQIAENAEQMRELENKRIEAERQVQYVQTLFSDHDFARLLAAKPGLIEKRMINATAAVLGDLEAATH